MAEALNANLAAVVNGQESGDRFRIQTLAGEILNNFESLFGSMSMLVRTIGGEGIESIGDGNHARQKRNLVSCEAVGVAAAIERFVMQFDAGEHLSQLSDRAQNVCALGGVRFHHFEFFGGKSSRFLEDAVFDADLAYVVKLRGYAQSFHEGSVQIQFFADHQRVARDPVGVTASVGVLFVDGAGQHLNRAEKQSAIFFCRPLQVLDEVLQFL